MAISSQSGNFTQIMQSPQIFSGSSERSISTNPNGLKKSGLYVRVNIFLTLKDFASVRTVFASSVPMFFPNDRDAQPKIEFRPDPPSRIGVHNSRSYCDSYRPHRRKNP